METGLLARTHSHYSHWNQEARQSTQAVPTDRRVALCLSLGYTYSLSLSLCAIGQSFYAALRFCLMSVFGFNRKTENGFCGVSLRGAQDGAGKGGLVRAVREMLRFQTEPPAIQIGLSGFAGEAAI